MIYDYKCKNCKLIFDIEHGINEEVKVMCPECNSECHKLYTVSKPIYKAKGFYTTDYKS